MEDIDLIKCKKILLAPIPSEKPAPNANFIYRQSLLLDDTNISIPGLTFEYTRKLNDSPVWNEKYTLFYRRDSSVLDRLFQIELYPDNYLSHREDGLDVYGNHIYYLGKCIKCYSKLDYGLESRSRWLRRFMAHTNITLVDQSKQPSLFSVLS